MAVLLIHPYQEFFDDNGNPLSGGKVYTYQAGTNTPKATFTDNTENTQAANPVELDSSGRATMWGAGSYKFEVYDSLNNLIRTTDNVSTYTTADSTAEAYFEAFSGNGTQTAFTLSEDLGTDEKAIMVYVDNGLVDSVTNGTFATDTDWTKGAGWTIGAGVATATGAISTAISQTASPAIVAGQAYDVVYTITRSAGGLIPSVGGQNGTERTASGTYREVIVAGTTQTLAFTGNAFTGTLDTVSITIANGKGYEIQSPSSYSLTGTTLTLGTAPESGTGNIYVFAPSLLVGAANAAAVAADASATLAAASAASAAGFSAAKNQWTFSTTTTMADPSTANLRLNNAALGSVTQIAISELSANSGNPDLSGWISTWDDTAGSNRGSLFIFKDNGNFAIYNINAALTDNTTWYQIPVTYVASAGSFSASDALYIGFTAAGTTTVTGGITALTGDVTASGSGSVVASIAANATITTPTLTLKQSASPTPTAEGAIEWDTDDNSLKIGDGSGTKTFYPDGLVLLSSQTVSGVASVAFTGLSSTYSNYILKMSNVVPATDATDLYVRTSSNGGSSYDSGASDYAWTRTGNTDASATAGAGGDVADAQMLIAVGLDNASTASLGGTVEIFEPASSARYKKIFAEVSYDRDGSTIAVFVTAGKRISATAVNAFQVLMSSGNISGTFTLYGVAK